MKKNLLMMSLFIFLLTGLSASSFFLPVYLTSIFVKNEHSAVQLSFAIKQENVSALRYAFKHSVVHSEQWLTLAKTLAKTQGEIAYQLALYYQKSPQKKVFWFKSASRLGYHQGTLALAEYYFEQDDFVKAAEVIATIPTILQTSKLDDLESSEQLAVAVKILIVKIAINQGKTVQVENNIRQYAKLLKSTETGRLLLNDIEKYQIIIPNKQTIEPNNSSLQCENSIQLFATKIAHLKQVEKIIDDFKTQPLNSAICFAPVRYMPINTLDCNDNQNLAIRCDEIKWQLYADSIDTRYVGVMLPKGGANVHLGMLYFDSQDTVDVVAHEISHLLGFVDEYPLKAEHIACSVPQKEPFSQNIAVLKRTYQGDRKIIRANVLKQLVWSKYIKSSTPILHSVTTVNGNQHWQLGTPKEFEHEIGLFNAQTCDETNAKKARDFKAYKGISQRTQLQYFSLSFPGLYSLLLQENSIRYRMPSFHYNIALAHFQQIAVEISASQPLSLNQIALNKKSLEQANYWLEQAAMWEDNRDRRKKIRQGSF